MASLIVGTNGGNTERADAQFEQAEWRLSGR